MYVLDRGDSEQSTPNGTGLCMCCHCDYLQTVPNVPSGGSGHLQSRVRVMVVGIPGDLNPALLTQELSKCSLTMVSWPPLRHHFHVGREPLQLHLFNLKAFIPSCTLPPQPREGSQSSSVSLPGLTGPVPHRHQKTFLITLLWDRPRKQSRRSEH